jgi:DNA-binding MarR family transcriptional regulator
MLAAFRYALRQFLHFSETAAAALGLTPQQHQALLAIMGFPGRTQVTVGELADRLQIRHHSAVGLVDRLAALGLVQREPARTDRRQVYVGLTPRGTELLERLAVVHCDELQRLGPQLHALLDRLAGETPERDG